MAMFDDMRTFLRTPVAEEISRTHDNDIRGIILSHDERHVDRHVWVPQHARGSLEHGTIKKRYEIATGE